MFSNKCYLHWIWKKFVIFFFCFVSTAKSADSYWMSYGIIICFLSVANSDRQKWGELNPFQIFGYSLSKKVILKVWFWRFENFKIEDSEFFECSAQKTKSKIQYILLCCVATSTVPCSTLCVSVLFRKMKHTINFFSSFFIYPMKHSGLDFNDNLMNRKSGQPSKVVYNFDISKQKIC